jgi:hypothetical protein
MIKFFSNTGRGYLQDESSMGDHAVNRSSKMLLSVGIPNGLINTLNKAIGINSENADESIVKSNSLIQITIYKKSLINPEDISYVPKKFIFDTSKFIFNNSNLLSDDLNSEYDANGIFERGMSGFLGDERLYELSRGVQGNVKLAFMTGDTIEDFIDDNIIGQNRRQKLNNIFMNHLTDHYSKMYARVMLGIDIDEDIYMLEKRDLGLITGHDTNELNDNIENLYMTHFYYPMQNLLDTYLPNENLGYTYEFNRLVNTAKKSNLFACQKYFHRAVLPKSFDRVFTMFIDEGDFLPVQSFGSSTSASETVEKLDTYFYDTNPAVFKKDGTAHTLGLTVENFQNADMFATNTEPPSNLTSKIFDETQGFTAEKMYQYYCTVKLVDDSAKSDFSFVKHFEDNPDQASLSERGFITIFPTDEE